MKAVMRLVIIMVLGVVLFLASTSLAESETDWWPVSGHDIQNTRSSASLAPRMPNLLWEFDGQFHGDEGVVVSEGKVYVGSDADTFNSLINTYFFCLNESDGSVIWTAQINGTVNNSPAVYGDFVVVGTKSGHLYCLDKNNGSKIWEVVLPSPVYISSPVVSNSRIFVGGGSYLYCFDIADGAELWSFQVYQLIYSSPAVFEGKVYASGTGPGAGKVYCLDEANGTKIWEFTAGDHVTTSPAVVNGRVFVGSDDHRVYCLDATSGNQIWNYTCSSYVVSSPAVAEGRIFTASEDGNVYCFEAATGSVVWIYKAVYQVVSSPSVADGMVFISSSNILRGVQAINKTDGTLIWNYTLAEAPAQGSSPIVADGKIFESFLGKICCIGSPFSLTIAPDFRDNNGETLSLMPSSWEVLFPNGTIREVFSNSVNYPKVENGNYSIASIIWQGYEVVPENKPMLHLDRNFTWNPIINCKLPTKLTVDLSTSTSFMGFWVNIRGKLHDYQNLPITGAQIILRFSVTETEPWSIITADYTETDGGYSALWVPSATGNYVVEAIYQGNETYPSSNSSINLAVEPYEATNVFSVVSNSSISELAFNTTDWTLSFTAMGADGTSGFTIVTVAKTLVANPADIEIYMDGNQTDFTVSSIDDSWSLYFTYEHSTHQIEVDLDVTIIPDLSAWIILLAIIVATAPMIIYRRRSQEY